MGRLFYIGIIIFLGLVFLFSAYLVHKRYKKSNANGKMQKGELRVQASMLLLFCTIAYMIVGLPVKAPVLTINNTELRLGDTTVLIFIYGIAREDILMQYIRTVRILSTRICL